MRAASDWGDRVLRAGADAAGGTLSGVPYGGEAWCRLSEGDPRHLGAVVLAAECWRIEGLFQREDLAQAGDLLDYALAHRLRQASWDVAGSPELWAALRLADVRTRANAYRERMLAGERP